jgi:prepilin-type N-terminal cleavage/methylation domain-containing protein
VSARPPRDAGVTLLELLVAVAILGVIAGLLYGTFSRTLIGRDRATVALERYAAGRAALDWLGRDLEGGFATGLFPSGGKRFFATSETEGPTLDRAPILDVTTTSSRSTTPLTGPALPVDSKNGGDQVRVLYHLENPAQPDGEPRASSRTARDVGFDLVRYEHRPPLRSELDDAARAVVAHGVASIELRFFDGAAWHEDWDSLAAGGEQRGVAPRVVEARIRMVSLEGEPVELVSAYYVTLGGRRRA